MAIVVQRPFAGPYAAVIARAATDAQDLLCLLSRLLSRTVDAQRRRNLDREATRLLDQSGGRLTDSMEREIACLYFGV
jgi:hypothetical protein